MTGTLLFDIESNGLLDTLEDIWCIAIYDYDTNSFEEYTPENIDAGLERILQADVLMGHNIMKFDIPAVEKYTGRTCRATTRFKEGHTDAIRDSLVISRLVAADIKTMDLDSRDKVFSRAAKKFRHILSQFPNELKSQKEFGKWIKKPETELEKTKRIYTKIKEDDRLNDFHAFLKLHLFPGQMLGRHGLKAWGYRLHCFKGEYEADPKDFFKQFSPEMMEYCSQDLRVNYKLFKHLDTFTCSEKAIALEHQVQDVIFDQEQVGWEFDYDKGWRIYNRLSALRDTLGEELKHLHDGWEETMKKPAYYTYNLDNVVFKNVNKKTLEDQVYEQSKQQGLKLTRVAIKNNIEVGPPAKRKIPFKPSSRDHMAAFFKEKYKWKPQVFNDKDGKPKIDGDILRGLPYPEARKFLVFDTLQDRCEKLKEGKDGGWLGQIYTDSRLRGGLITNGAVTGRATHNRPNLGQVPASYSPFGKPCRSLFKAKEDYVLVGSDADGLELRCLAHYMALYDGGEYARIVDQGRKVEGTDIHTVNQKAAGLPSRDNAKTFIYACVTMDTQVLTRDGWKEYADVEVGEDILVYDSENNEKLFSPVLEKVYYPEAEVTRMHHTTFDFKCTPNHRWFTEKRVRRSSGSEYIPEVVTTEELTSEHNIIMNASFNDIGQEDRLIEPFSDKYSTDWVKKLCKADKKINETFLIGFLLADGYINKHGQWIWNQNTNNLSEAAILASYLARKGRVVLSDREDSTSPMKVCRLNKRSHTTCQKMNFTSLNKQPVWCVKTKYDSFVARQGNTITITGNTLYGAGPQKIGKIVDGDIDRGKELLKQFYTAIPALKTLQDTVKKRVNQRGSLIGLDGRVLHIRHDYAALNTLLQSCGAIICKKWLVEVTRQIQAEGLDARQVGWVHDEIQIEAHKDCAERVAEICVDAMPLVEEYFEFKCPLKASADIGLTWKETH